MECLSIDVLNLVLRKLDVKSLVQSAGVCNLWKGCASNWRLWQAFYFERWPRFKDDIAYKKSVSLDWMQLYIRMRTYSRDVLRLHTVSMNESVRTLMEETLISPYVITKSCLFAGTGSGRFYDIYKAIEEFENKNELFVPFLHDLSLLSLFVSFEEVFLNALTAAKAQHKKILLLVNDFDDTPAGINPIITNPQQRDEVIKILTHYQEDIILMLYSNGPDCITEPWIKLFASWPVNMVHVQLPNLAVRREWIQKLIVRQHTDGDDTFNLDIDCELLAEKTAGATLEDIRQVINSPIYAAIKQAVEAQTIDTDPIHVMVTTEDVLKALPTIHYDRDLTKPVYSATWDAGIVQTLKRFVDENPTMELITL